jgi:hypothetical protein
MSQKLKSSTIAAPETKDDVQQVNGDQNQGYNPQQSGKLAPITAKQETFPWHILLLGAVGTIVLYTALFFAALCSLWLINTIQYGPTHTSYLHTKINEQPATVITSNDGGDITIIVKVTQKDGTVQTQTLSGPTLNPDIWNGDLSGIVATAQVNSQQDITIHLVGNINYFHLLFARPARDFVLVPDKQGYKIVAS